MHGISAVRQDFEPTDIQGCQIWLRSDRGVRRSGISPSQITKWENQVSDFSFTGTQGTSALQPTIVPGVNGLPAIHFNSAAFQMLTLSPNSAAYGRRTFVIVLKLTTEPHSGFSVISVANGAGTAAHEMIFDLATYSACSFIADAASGNMVGINDTLGTTTPHALLHTWDATTYFASLDGTSKTVVTSGAYGAGTLTSAIGSRSDATFPFNGDLYEIIMWNRVLSAKEQDQVRDYLRLRYGT